MSTAPAGLLLRWRRGEVGREAARRRGRAVIAEVVAEMTGATGASVVVDATCPDCGEQHGAPRVVAPAGGPGVSVTHAGELTVVAVVAAGSVGVDAEPIAQPGGRAAAIADLCGLPAETSEVELLRHWTRVEAVLKADGRGLRVDPRRVSIDADADGGIRGRVAGAEAVYRVWEVVVSPEVVVSVAVALDRPEGGATAAGAASGRAIA